MREFFALEEPHAVLRRDGPAAFRHRVMHDAVEATPLAKERLGVHALGLAEVEMDVSVADMPEGADAQPRHLDLAGCTRLDEEIRDAADGHRDIVLDGGALMLLDFGQALSQMPEALGLPIARGDGRILDLALLQGGFQHFEEQRFEIGVRLGAREFDEGIGCVPRRKGITRARRMAHHDFQPEARDELESREAVTRALPKPREEGDDLRRSRGADEGRGTRFRQREELQHGFRDDAQRALRADKQVLQIITRIILAERRESVPDRAIGQHHFKAEHEIARVAVAQNRRAAGIGGDVPADGAGAFGGERERIEEARFARRLLHLGEHGACFHGDRGIDRIDRSDGLEALQRNHHAAMGHASTDEARIPALRQKGDTRRMAGLHHGRNLGRVRGHHGGDGRALREPPRFCEEWREILRRDTHMLLADDGAELREKIGGRHGRHPVLIWARRAATS